MSVLSYLWGVAQGVVTRAQQGQSKKVLDRARTFHTVLGQSKKTGRTRKKRKVDPARRADWELARERSIVRQRGNRTRRDGLRKRSPRA